MPITLVIKALKTYLKYEKFEVRAFGKTTFPLSSKYNLSNSGIVNTCSCERWLLAVVQMESV